MKTLLVSSFFGFILLFLTTSDFAKELFTPAREVFENPLDRIVGEKKLDDGSLREDNFDSILKIRASFLKDSSELYEIKKLRKDLFLLTRKAFFNQNRFYSIFLKTKEDKIVFYQVTNDFTVKDAFYSNQKIYFIGDEYTATTNSWNATSTLRITCVDLNFNKKWTVVSLPYKGYYCFGRKLKLVNDKLIATMEIQGAGSSTMCTSFCDLILDKAGNIEHHICKGGSQCGPGPDEISPELFAKTQ